VPHWAPPGIVCLLLLSGCITINGDGEDTRDGHARLYWGQSNKSCNNNVCTYGQNSARLMDEARCDGTVQLLKWTGTNIIHGSATVRVEDDDGTDVYSSAVGNRMETKRLEGAGGTWVLHLDTHDLNGQLTVSLDCS
jgi:hypothetical protein